MRLFLEIDTVFIKPIWKAIQVSIKYTGWGNKSYGHETNLRLFLIFFFFFSDITKLFAIISPIKQINAMFTFTGTTCKLNTLVLE